MLMPSLLTSTRSRVLSDSSTFSTSSPSATLQATIPLVRTVSYSFRSVRLTCPLLVTNTRDLSASWKLFNGMTLTGWSSFGIGITLTRAVPLSFHLNSGI
ncbi:hypothetical protein D3C75_907150 [compost metagenome]